MEAISYKEPAKSDGEKFPVGNGRLGALVAGGIACETVNLFEESVWTAPFADRINKDSHAALAQIQKATSEGRMTEAIQGAKESLQSVPPYCASYKAAGSLHVEFFADEGWVPLEKPSVYERKLDLETGLVKTSLSCETSRTNTAIFARSSSLSSGSSITYTREIFSTSVDDVLAIHVSASIPKSVYLRAYFDCEDGRSNVFTLDDDTLVMEEFDGIPKSFMMMASLSGGKCRIKGGCMIIEAADDATLYIDVESAYRNNHYRRRGGNVSRSAKALATWASDRALKKLCFAQAKPYLSVKEDHCQEFSRSFNRVRLDLCGDAAEQSWNYARYLLLSSSKAPGSLPPLAGGLWNIKGSDTRYDLVNAARLPVFEQGFERCVPQFKNYAKALYKKGVKVSRAIYGNETFAVHTCTDIWGDAAPVGTVQDTSSLAAFTPIKDNALSVIANNYKAFTLETKALGKAAALCDEKPHYEFALNESSPSCFAPLCYTTKIADVSLHDSCVRIKLFDSDNFSADGSLTGLYLPGNLRLDIEWKDRTPCGGRIYAKHNCADFIKKLCVVWKGKEYETTLFDGSVEILNLLPSTLH